MERRLLIRGAFKPSNGMTDECDSGLFYYPIVSESTFMSI